MIYKLSPFVFDFGGISNCFCNEELYVFQKVFQYIFSGRSNTDKVEIWEKENQNICGVGCTTQPLHLGSMVEMSHDFKGKNIISRRTGRAEVQSSIPAFLTFLFIILTTSAPFSFVQCYFYNFFTEPQNGL